MELKIAIPLLLFSVTTLLADPSYSQTTKINLAMENKKLELVMDEIERQSEFYFIFNQKQIDVDRVISVRANNELITSILPLLFSGTHVNFAVVDRKIFLTTDPIQRQVISALADEEVLPKRITGTVTDKSGDPLPGVNVFVTGTTMGTTTDQAGKYSLEVPDGARSLTFSYVGMEPQEVVIGVLNQIDVTLSESVFALEDVVVVGYGTSSKTKLVSSVSQIKTDKIQKVPFPTVVEALAGRAPGLFMQHNASAGDGVLDKVSIRGGGEPLYIINGIKSTKQMFAMLASQDIENISVLKDASATSVYGSQAGDGIILVTTKTGAGQKLRVDYGSSLSFQTRLINPKWLDLYGQAQILNEAAYRDAIAQPVSDELLEKYRTGSDPQYKSTDYYDAVVKKFAPFIKHNLSLSGESKNTTMYLSLNYQTQDGPFNYNESLGTDRYSVRANVSHKLESIGLTVSGLMEWAQFNAQYPASGSGNVWDWTRIGIGLPLFNPAGNIYQYGNPVGLISDGAGYRKEQSNWINNRISLLWELPWVKGLSVNVFGNYLYETGLNKNWNKTATGMATFYMWDNSLGAGQGKPSLAQTATNRDKLDFETQVNYNKTIAGKHNISLTAVYTEYNQHYTSTYAYRRDYLSKAVDQIFAGATAGQQNSGSGSEEAMRGWVGRAKYDYQSRYIVEFSGRYDGSDNFAPEKRWGFFPAVSAGWNIANESFMKSIAEKMKMNSLKLRASWGKTGLTTGAARFGYIPTYNMVTDNYYAGGSWWTGFTEGNLISPDFTWYERTSRNIGVDFAFLNNRLSGGIDWFYYRTTNYLASPTGIYSTPLGKSLPQIMTNSAHRRGGAEFLLAYKTQLAGININIGGTVSYYNQLWETKYDESASTLKNPYTRLTHEKDYYTVGYTNRGYYQTMDDIYNNPRLMGLTRYIPGQTFYKDTNGDGKVDSRDQRRIGTSMFPHVVYGVNLDLEYKGFALNALFQGAAKRQLYLGYVWYASMGRRNYDIQKDNNWREDQRDAMFPVLSTVVSDYQITSDKYLVNSGYVRLKSLSISYDLKNTLLQHLDKIGEFSLVLSGTNIFTLSELNKYYIDPESAEVFDNFRFPANRAFSIGVRLSF